MKRRICVFASAICTQNRPGGNITGFTGMSAEQGVKRLELLKELLPGLKKAALLGDAQMTEATRNAMRAAAATLQVELAMVDIRNEADIVGAFADMQIIFRSANQTRGQAAKGVRQRGPLRHGRERYARQRHADHDTADQRDDDPLVVDHLRSTPCRDDRQRHRGDTG